MGRHPELPWRRYPRHGFNPPDLIFPVAWALRPFGVRYPFDHHDICPELYETKFGQARRGGMAPEDVFVARSGPKIEKLELRPPRPELKRGPRSGTFANGLGPFVPDGLQATALPVGPEDPDLAQASVEDDGGRDG